MLPDSRQINHFVVTAHSKTLTDAARNLFITQPALSMSLKSLEEELGLKLFQRNGRNLVLTSEGKIILEYAEKVIEDLKAVTQVAQRLNKSPQNFSIAFCDPGPYWYFAPRIGTLLPDLTLEIRLLPDACKPENLANAEFDIVISDHPFSNFSSDFASEILIEDHTILSIPRDRPEFCRANGFEPDEQNNPLNSLSIKEIRNLEIVFLNLKGVFSKQKEKLHQLMDASVVYEECSDYFIFKHRLQQKNAATFTTELVLSYRDDGKNRLLVPISDELASITYYINWRKQESFIERNSEENVKPILSAFREFVSEFNRTKHF